MTALRAPEGKANDVDKDKWPTWWESEEDEDSDEEVDDAEDFGSLFQRWSSWCLLHERCVTPLLFSRIIRRRPWMSMAQVETMASLMWFRDVPQPATVQLTADAVVQLAKLDGNRLRVASVVMHSFLASRNTAAKDLIATEPSACLQRCVTLYCGRCNVQER